MATQIQAAIYVLCMSVPIVTVAVARHYRALRSLVARRAFDPDSSDPDARYNPSGERSSGPRHSDLAVKWHRIVNYQYTPLRWVNNMGLGELVQLCIYLLLNIIFMTIPMPNNDPAQGDIWQFTEISSRAAWTGTGNAFFILMTATRNSILEQITGIPFERMIMYHRWAGRVLCLQFSLHAVIEITNYDRKMVFPLYGYGFGWGSIFNTYHPNNMFAFFALMFLLVLVGTSHSVFRRRFFNTFYMIHFSFIGFMIFGSLHSIWFLKWNAAGMVLYVIDRGVRHYKSRAECDTLAVQSFPDSDIIKLVLLPVRFHYESGQYAFINVPALGRLGWYPFSLSSAPDLVGRDRRVTFHIKDNGDYTRELVKMVKVRETELKLYGKDGAEAPRFKIWIDGGYGRASEMFEDNEVCAMVAGGIGITPMLSIISSLVQRHETDLPTATTDIYLFWYIPNLGVYRALAPELLDVRKRAARLQRRKDIVVDFKIYVTRDVDRAMKDLDMFTAAEKEMLVLGRGNVETSFRELKEKHADQDVAVGVCGAKQMVRAVRNASVACSNRDGLFNVHWETFAF